MGEQRRYSVKALAEKVEWEGGILDTAVDYGLDPADIDDSTPEGAEIKGAWTALQQAHRAHVEPLLTRLAGLLDVDG